MSRAKRIYIISDITYNPAKMFWNPMPKLIKGIIRAGHDVRLFSYRTALFEASPIKSKRFVARFCKSRVDELLADQIRNYCPDIIFIAFPRVLDAETIVRVRQEAPNAVFVGHDVDPWPKLQKSNKIGTAKELDILIATNDGEFLEHYRDAGVPSCAFMPNVCDPDVDHRYEVDSKWEADILWTGKATHGANSSDALREQLVHKLAQRKNCSLYGCLGRPKIGGIDYLYAISGARIGANVNAVNSVRLYHSDRITNYLAGGTFVLAKRVPDTDLLFSDNEHLRYFDTVEEFFDLADWYLAHEQERKRIADAGMRWVHEQFNCVRIAGYIIELVERGSYDAPWNRSI